MEKEDVCKEANITLIAIPYPHGKFAVDEGL
jgi:hypothetical protein